MAVFKERSFRLLAAISAIVALTLLLSFYLSSSTTKNLSSFPVLCTSSSSSSNTASPRSDSINQASYAEISDAILHYATSRIVPQQSKSEIQISLDVLLKRRPCNFLVYGLGLDSRMWNSFNPGGFTLFLEEDPRWLHNVLQGAPHLRAEFVKYPTQLKDADQLLATYKNSAQCLPRKAFVQGNSGCKLALSELPKVFYEREWDLIMIDAPKGFFPEAPGRMAAIWTAAVMARQRKGEGYTDVFLHDVDRKVEKAFALEFLCEKYRVAASGRLWHFRIPAVREIDTATSFC